MDDAHREPVPAPAPDGGGAARSDDDGYARFAETELAVVLSRWDLGPLELVEPCPRGSRRSPKLHLEGPGGTAWLLKRHERDGERVRFAHEVMRGLAGAGAEVARLVPTRDGRTVVHLSPFAYELQTWIEGRPSRAGEETARAAGTALARLHEAAYDLRPEHAPSAVSFHGNARSVRSTLEHVPERIVDAGSRDGGAVDADDLARACRWLRRAYRDAAERVEAAGFDALPAQVIHGDLHPGNVILDPADGSVRGIVDFDAARIEPRVVDVANAALQYAMERTSDPDPATWPGRLSARTIRELLEGYDDAAQLPLQPHERACLPWLMLEALVVETAATIVRTGAFGGLPGGPFLLMVERKARWIRERSGRLLKWLDKHREGAPRDDPAHEGDDLGGDTDDVPSVAGD